MGREQRLAPAGRQADTAIGRRAFQPLDRGIATLGKSRRTVALRLVIAFDPRDRRRIGRAEIARTALAKEKAKLRQRARSDERRVGKEGVSTCSSSVSPYN